MAKRPVTVENPFDDAELVETLRDDLAAEERGEIEEGLTREEFAERYEQYLPDRR